VISADAPRDENAVRKKMVIARLLIHHLPRGFRLLAHQNNQRQLGELITSRSVRTHRPRRSPGRDVKLIDAPRDGKIHQVAGRRCIKLLKCASSSRVPSLGASRVMLQGVSRRARVAAAELARTRGERKMCRETENALFNDEDGAEFNDISHHIFTTVSVSRHILMKKITSRPARVWRVTRPEPEATRATHRQETKMPTSEQDVRMVMWTAKMSTSCCGHLRLRFRLLAMEN
jgi:hypothetical protein